MSDVGIFKKRLEDFLLKPKDAFLMRYVDRTQTVTESEALTSGANFKGAPKASVIKRNHIFMQYFEK